MPTPVSTERWSDRRYQKQTGGMRCFDVAFATTEEQALATVAQQNSVFRNATHPLDPQLRVRGDGMDVNQPGFNLYRVQATYAAGTFDGGNDKTLEPPTYQWLPENVTEAISTDIDGNVITNSAGDLPSPSPTRTLNRHGIVIARYEPAFPISRVNTYANAINSDSFQINGYLIQPGQAYMKAITQIAEAKLSATFVRVRYYLIFHPGFTRGADGVWDGFQLRFPDKGNRAFFLGSTKRQNVYLLNDAGDLVQQNDVLLNGLGAPYFNEFISKNKQIGQSQQAAPVGATIVTPPNGVGAVLVWKNYKKAPFGALNLFF